MRNSLHVKMLQTTLLLQEVASQCYSPERFLEIVQAKLNQEQGTTFSSYKKSFRVTHQIKAQDKTHIISANFNVKYRSKFNDELLLEGPLNEDVTVRQINEAQLFMQNPHTDLTFIEEAVEEHYSVSERYSGKHDRHQVCTFSDGSLIVMYAGKVVYVSD